MKTTVISFAMLFAISAALGADVSPVAPRALRVVKEAQFRFGIRTVVLRPQPISRDSEAKGSLTRAPDAVAELRSPDPGRLVLSRNTIAKKGTRVVRGEVLAMVEVPVTAGEQAVFQLLRDDAAVELQKQEHETARARREVRRLEKLSDVVPAKEIEAARAELRSAEEDESRSRKRISAIDAALAGKGLAGPRRIVAPFDGVVLDSSAGQNQFVERGDTLFRLLDPTRLWVRVHADPAIAAQIGHSARIVFRTPEYSQNLFPAKLVANGNAGDGTMYLAVNNPGGRLREGMDGTVEINTESSRTGLLIPPDARTTLEGEDVVFVHTAPEAFQLRPVRLGTPLSDGLIPVEAGLQAGDRIVIQGVDSLVSVMRGGF
ncbi:MAG: efflux RND transporter periplasmic adaptor subunit [Thermoanaerobaculia bacterium]